MWPQCNAIKSSPGRTTCRHCRWQTRVTEHEPIRTVFCQTTCIHDSGVWLALSFGSEKCCQQKYTTTLWHRCCKTTCHGCVSLTGYQTLFSCANVVAFVLGDLIIFNNFIRLTFVENLFSLILPSVDLGKFLYAVVRLGSSWLKFTMLNIFNIPADIDHLFWKTYRLVSTVIHVYCIWSVIHIGILDSRCTVDLELQGQFHQMLT